MENEDVQVQDSNEQEEEALETSDEESSSELEARLAKAEELAQNYKIRAEKAERLAKASRNEAPTTQKQTPTAGDLGTKDLYALMEAKVPQDDIDEVTEYAKFKGISVAEALKSNVVKTMLSDKAEMRNTAQASNVGTARRGSAKVSDDVLLSKASKGELPDNDDDMMRVIRARKGYKN